MICSHSFTFHLASLYCICVSHFIVIFSSFVQDIALWARSMCLDCIVRCSTPCVLVWYTYGFSPCTHSYVLWWFDCYSTSCRPSILSLDTDFYPMGVTCTHRSHMAPLGPFLGLVGVRASCGLVCGPLWCVCGSFWRVIMTIFLVVHITL